MNLMQATTGPLPAFDPDLLRQARRQAELGGRRLMEVLEETLALAPDAFVASLASALHYPALTMAEMQRLSPAFDAISFAEAMEHECLAFRADDGRLLTVSGDPFNGARLAWLGEHLRVPFSHHLAHPADIAAWLARQEDGLTAMGSALASTDKVARHGQAVEDLSLKAISSDTSPVVKLVHSTLYDAFKGDASDIHLETGATGLTIKYRVDGVLIPVGAVEGVDLAGQILSRIKVMSELDIAESRVPQDGRFKVTMRGREIDVRVSIMPSIFGEDAVLRILDKQALTSQINGLRLDCLGFDAETIEQLQRLSAEPYGMLLVTGPTGSGKTTTLYAALTEINHGQDKIVTIEDPVEYQLPGVLQIPVNEKKGLTFARGLRSILRHDPDKIMVGEIRDPETAQIAVQSALTGHLVFTTVHANNVFDVIGRFMHMGVDLYSFVSSLNGVLAQRLVRVNCPHCSTQQRPDAKLLAFSRLTPEQVAEFDFRAGSGCGHCRGSGYKGRKAIAELLFLNDEIRELIVARQPIRLIKAAAQRSGTRFLRQAALELVRRGETTLQEINRVTFVA